MRLSDSNCIQIMMCADSTDAPGGSSPCAERIGNVAREEAAVLAAFMDNKLSDSLDDATYDVDYKFDCSLSEDLNHRAEGYKIKIILY